MNAIILNKAQQFPHKLKADWSLFAFMDKQVYFKGMNTTIVQQIKQAIVSCIWFFIKFQRFIQYSIKQFNNILQNQLSIKNHIQSLNFQNYPIIRFTNKQQRNKMKLNKKICFSLTYYPKNMNLSYPNTFYHKDLEKRIIPNRQKPSFDPKKLLFGVLSTDHMININFKNNKWEAPVLSPFKLLQLHPFNSTLHYGVTCYQGLKAYKNEKGQIRLFRPQCNMSRFKKSSVRASLPNFDGAELLKILVDYVKLEEQYIPPYKGYSLYLRPFHISLEDSLGVKSPNESQILIVSSPVGPYYPTGFNPISLYCDTKNVRSAPNGTGGYKLGGNYGPTIQLGNQAASKGHQQVLWLFNGKVGQVGSSNILFVLKDRLTDKIKVITPKLQDLVLPGVTRDSIIELLKQKGIQVEQRIIMIDQVCHKIQSGQIIQMFGAGTAVIVSPIKGIQYNGKQYNLKLNQKYKSGELTYQIFNDMLDIQEGRKTDSFNWVRLIKQ